MPRAYISYVVDRPSRPKNRNHGLSGILLGPQGQSRLASNPPRVSRVLTASQTLLARNYRGDIPMSAVEKFPGLLSEAEEESSAVPPCFSDEGINVRVQILGSTQGHWQTWRRRRSIHTLADRPYSISTSGTTTSTSSPSQNATPTPPKFSSSSTK